MEKKPKIFISHSSEDKGYVKLLVELLNGVGLTEEYIFCSSLPGYDIPVGKDIFNYLREQFSDNNLHVFFIHSKNYYESAVSLNEMGAAWALKTECTSILLPGFDFSEMKGVVNSNTISIKLDNDEFEVKDKLNQVYDMLVGEFGLTKIKDIFWEQKRNIFISSAITLNFGRTTEDRISLLSTEAINILQNAGKDANGQIIKVPEISGTVIQAGSILMNKTGIQRENAKMEAALQELIDRKYVSQGDSKGVIFQITNAGYSYLEALD